MASRNSVNPKQDKPKANHAHKHNNQTTEKPIFKKKILSCLHLLTSPLQAEA